MTFLRFCDVNNDNRRVFSLAHSGVSWGIKAVALAVLDR